MEPPLLKNREQIFDIFHGKRPMIVSSLSIATAYLSALLVGSLLHINTSPNAAAQIVLYTWYLASFPGAEEGDERAPGTQCLHMRVVIAKATW